MRFFLAFFAVLICFDCFAQRDTSLFKTPEDSIAFYESVKEELKLFMGVMNAEESYLNIEAGLGTGYFTLKSPNDKIVNQNKLYYSGDISYNHRSGLSLTVKNLFTTDRQQFSWFQTSISPGYQYTKSSDWKAGINYTRYLNKDSLSFYTSPLINEFYAQVKYTGGWVKPGIAAAYGFGSRDAVTRRRLRLITSTESINDFALYTTLEHQFTWLDILGNKDGIAFTPTFVLISGTNKYGINRSISNMPGYLRKNNKLRNLLNSVIDDNATTPFRAISFTALFDVMYRVNNFYIQPQLLFDYYIPKEYRGWKTFFNVSAGIDL